MDQGYASVDWSRLETFGINRDSKRWKFNRHAPEGHSRSGKTDLVRKSNATHMSFVKLTDALTGEELPASLQPEHSIRNPIIQEKKRLLETKRQLARKVAVLARQKGWSHQEAAQHLADLIKEDMTPKVIMENR
jgi:hypothetical protein